MVAFDRYRAILPAHLVAVRSADGMVFASVCLDPAKEAEAEWDALERLQRYERRRLELEQERRV